MLQKNFGFWMCWYGGSRKYEPETDVGSYFHIPYNSIGSVGSSFDIFLSVY